METLKREINYLLNKGKSPEELKQEVDTIINTYTCWKNSDLFNNNREFFFNKEFEITTYSWQVDESNLRGKYIVLMDGKNDNDDDSAFFCKNLATEREILVTKETLIYFLTVPDQDLKFVYVGIISGMSEYPCVAI